MRYHRLLFVILIAILLLLRPGGAQPARAAAFTTCASVTEIPPSECDALVALYNSTNGVSWADHTNWLATDTPSDWHQVVVSNGHVTGLSLGGNQLSGSIPAQLGSLTNLRFLDLGYNQLSGSIPAELGSLTNLQVSLYLNNNQLSGSIPSELGNLNNLQGLYLDKNQLSGSIPPQLGGMTNLQDLELHDNPLSGTIPLSFTGLVHLTSFSADNTYVCEPQDTGFQALKATVSYWHSPGVCATISGHVNRPYGPLVGVTLSASAHYSATSGPDGAYTLTLPQGSYTLTPVPTGGYSFVPASLNVSAFGNVTGQDFIALRPFSTCASEPDIPAVECSALVALYNSANGASWTHHDNWLVTDTPSDWYGVTVSAGHVTALALNGNQLSGSISAQLGNLTSMQTLDLSSNNLSGGIPTQLDSLAALQTLDLSSNPLGGSIPTQLGSLVNLQFLELEDDQLTGAIPHQLGGLANLTILVLGESSSSSGSFKNQLTGSIPPELGSLTQLMTLALGSNQLSGSIPPELGNLVNLDWLVLSNNQLNGSIPSQLSNLKGQFFNELDLSYNQLSGSVPPELGSMTNLQMLNLSHNQLSGSIPRQLGSLANLQNLNLSSNQLSGGIPPQVSSLTKLNTLDLSSNGLTGSIPSQLGILANLQNLNLSSNLLTGSLPSQLSALTNLHLLNVSTNPLSLRIPLSYTYLTHLTTFNAGNTWVCVPQDSAFLAWINSVGSWTSPGLCHTISGQVTKPGGVVPNVTIWDGAVHSTTTDVTGAYTLLDLPPASYSLTASLAGHAFIPASLGVDITNADVTGADFHEVFAISGTITVGGKPLAGVTVTDDSGHSTITGADGSYTLLGLVPGDYVVTPSLAGMVFKPASIHLTITNAAITGQDFRVLLSFYIPLVVRQ